MLQNILDPAVLFFFFGVFAALVRSNLEIPAAISKFFSLYLLLSVGFKGGVSMGEAGFSADVAKVLGLAMLMALIVPLYSYVVLKRKLNPFDAAAVAATYGSVSAVTFITATNYLEKAQIPFGGHMSVALVIMESPAIVMAVLLTNWIRTRQESAGSTSRISMKPILHEAFTDGAHLLLLGGLLVGLLTGLEGKKVMDPFTGHIFKGMLAFFLLEMGLMVGRKTDELKKTGFFLLAFGILMPLFSAILAIGLSFIFSVNMGDAILLTVLSASASYIVVPAVIRYAIPEANPSIYFGVSLVVTFPFNILIGIPAYTGVIKLLWDQG